MKPADQTPPDQWPPLKEVFVRVRRCVGDCHLALYDIKRALNDGKVAARERSLITRTGHSETRELSAEFWQTATLSVHDEFSDHVVVRTKQRNDELQPTIYHYYLRRSDVEKVWPESRETATASEKPWRKSAAGAKGEYDWEKILIEAARYMWINGRPESLADLCAHIEEWAGDDAPGESQLKNRLGPLYRTIRDAEEK